MAETAEIHDLFVIGGGVNGCGIARDAAGRGLKVMLAEQGDLASGTSSASTKLFHGGLRYLEFFEIRLVREALRERETLLKAMPHISRPMRFVLPLNPDMRFDANTTASHLLAVLMPWLKGRRPAWMIRAGLFLYDHMGGRKILPGTKRLDLRQDPAGGPLKGTFSAAFEYSDCWIDDSRLVALNARAAADLGATILTETRVMQARRVPGAWNITLRDTTNGAERRVLAKALVNAGGPWVATILKDRIHIDAHAGIRLVRGSHIVTRKLFDHDRAYFLQGEDGRIVFVLPYEDDFSLIGTTDADHSDPETRPECTEAERDYLLRFVSDYFRKPVTQADIVHSFSGVRPLFDDGAGSATAATRDYVLKLDTEGAPLLSVFGGKITTYRRLAEQALARLGPHLETGSGDWTAGAALPGGDFPVSGGGALEQALLKAHPYLSGRDVRRMIRAYGTDAGVMLKGAKSRGDLGQAFGAGLFACEVNWLMEKEFARTADDVVWRRSKLGLHLNDAEVAALDSFMAARRTQPSEGQA